MTQFFGRSVSLSAGPRGQAFPLLITKLRIVFKIEKTLEKTPNNAQIDIYNLSEASRALLEKKNCAVRLEAGYGGKVREIFTGDIGVVTTKRNGPDVISSIEAFDGLLEYQTAEADLSFGQGVSVGTVFDSMLQSFGIGKGEIQGFNRADTYMNGASFAGKLRDHLDALFNKQGDLSWSIQSGALQVLPKTGRLSLPAILLTPSTGLVGSPFKRTVVTVDVSKKKDGKDVENGSSLKSLLNPEITPGRLLDVQAKFVKGLFITQKIVHTGDTHSQSFYSDAETVSL